MSVEYCVVRLSPATLEQLRQSPEQLAELMDTYYTRLLEPAAERDCLDAREAYSGRTLPTAPALRMLHIDEFTASLLVDFGDEAGSPVFDALVGWDTATPLEGFQYGHGTVYAYDPSAAAEVAARLAAHPPMLLEAHFRADAARFRSSARGYFADDSTILAHQRRFAEALERLYREAAHDGDAVLLLTV